MDNQHWRSRQDTKKKKMLLTFDSNFVAWLAVLESETLLFLTKSYKPENDKNGKQKETLTVAMLKKSVDESILKECTRISDKRATYASVLQEIKEIWAKGVKRRITSEDLPSLYSRDDWDIFKDRCNRLLIVGYTQSTILELLQVKLVDKNIRNLIQSKEFTQFSEAAQFMDKIDWPEQAAAVRGERPSLQGQGQSTQNRRRTICYKCGRPGHIQRFCWTKNSGDPSQVQ